MTPANHGSKNNPKAFTAAQAKTKQSKALVAGIIALFAEGAIGYGLLVGIRSLLIAYGLPLEVAEWLALLASTKTEFPNLDVGAIGPMQRHAEKQAAAWRALYVLAAAQRLEDAADIEHAQKVEEGYFQRHVDAELRRIRAAALVDVTSRLLGDRVEEQSGSKVPLLGWRAVIDNRTTPECRWANGQNFRADRIPAIGMPGSVHPRCRCTSGPPIKGAPLLPSV